MAAQGAAEGEDEGRTKSAVAVVSVVMQAKGAMMLWTPEEYITFIESELDKAGARGTERWIAECAECKLDQDYSTKDEAWKVVAEHKNRGHRAKLGCRHPLPNGAIKSFPFMDGL